MKKLLALLLALLMVFAFVACDESDTPGNTDTSGSTDTPGTSQDGNSGDKNTGGEESGSGTEVKDITPENWDKVISKNFGLDLTLPDGWSVKEASSPNRQTNVKLFFNVGGDATYATFGETVFAEIKKDAVGDISAPYDYSEIYTSFEEAETMTGIASFAADVDGDKGDKFIIINYYDNETNVEITIQRSGNWN